MIRLCITSIGLLFILSGSVFGQLRSSSDLVESDPKTVVIDLTTLDQTIEKLEKSHDALVAEQKKYLWNGKVIQESEYKAAQFRSDWWVVRQGHVEIYGQISFIRDHGNGKKRVCIYMHKSQDTRTHSHESCYLITDKDFSSYLEGELNYFGIARVIDPYDNELTFESAEGKKENAALRTLYEKYQEIDVRVKEAGKQYDEYKAIRANLKTLRTENGKYEVKGLVLGYDSKKSAIEFQRADNNEIIFVKNEGMDKATTEILDNAKTEHLAKKKAEAEARRLNEMKQRAARQSRSGRGGSSGGYPGPSGGRRTSRRN